MSDYSNKMDEQYDNQKQEKGSTKGNPNGSIMRMIIFLGIMFLLFAWFSGQFNSMNQTTLSYSAFKEQIQKGNISEITMQGKRISGSFKSSYETNGNNGPEQSFTSFNTVIPSIDDPELMNLLEKNNVTINAKSDEQSWLSSILILLLPWLLIFGLIFYANRRMRGNMKGIMDNGIFGVGKSPAKRYRHPKIQTYYDDVAGLENAKLDLREIVDYLKNPKKFTSLGAEIPKGVLLMGPPGTGKTLLARATAGEAGVPFYSISGSEFIEMFVGVGASRVRDMFNKAKKEAPAILFIDEIDSVGRTRGTGLGGGHDEREQTLNQILSEMDGFEPHQSVVVIAATNRPDVLDPALIRPGRFDRQIALDLPQKNARKQILTIHTRKVTLGDNVDLNNIAARTVGFSGADLHNLVNEAALLAGRKGKNKVEASEFEEASDKILLGAEREERIDDDEKQIIAFHEAGHALIAALLPKTDPLQKVTIIPRGRALGVTEQIPENDRHNFSKNYLLSRITVSLGGHAAEQIIFNEITNGAAQDLKHATQIARKMVCQWGMSDVLGPVAFSRGEEHPFLGRELSQEKDFSEHTSRIIDDEIRNIVISMKDKAVHLLTSNRSKLENLANALLENETLEKNDIKKIVA